MASMIQGIGFRRFMLILAFALATFQQVAADEQQLVNQVNELSGRIAELERDRENLIAEVRLWRDDEMPKLQRRFDEYVNACNADKGAIEERFTQSQRELSTCNEQVERERQSHQQAAVTAEKDINNYRAQIQDIEFKRAEAVAASERLSNDLRQVREEQIPSLEKKFQENLAQAEEMKKAETKKYNDYQKETQEKTKKFEKQIEDLKKEIVEVRKESFVSTTKYRELKSEIDSTLFFFNFELVKPFLGPLPQVYDDSVDPIVSPIYQQILKALEPFHQKFVTVIRESSGIALKSFRKKDYPDSLVKIAQLITKKPEQAAIWYYRFVGFLIFYILYSLLFSGSKKTTSAADKNKRNKKKNQ